MLINIIVRTIALLIMIFLVLPKSWTEYRKDVKRVLYPITLYLLILWLLVSVFILSSIGGVFFQIELLVNLDSAIMLIGTTVIAFLYRGDPPFLIKKKP